MNENKKIIYIIFLLVLLAMLTPANPDLHTAKIWVSGAFSFMICGLIQDKVFDIKHIYFSSKKERKE
jgi:hypothetical protein